MGIRYKAGKVQLHTNCEYDVMSIINNNFYYQNLLLMRLQFRHIHLYLLSIPFPVQILCHSTEYRNDLLPIIIIIFIIVVINNYSYNYKLLYYNTCNFSYRFNME